MTISMKREDLLKHLAAQLERAKIEDKRIAAVHKKDEQQALVNFRANLREAMKWDYGKVKKNAGRYDFNPFNPPACPSLNSTFIQAVIQHVNWDTRKAPFRIAENSELHRAVAWVPDSEKPPHTVCD